MKCSELTLRKAIENLDEFCPIKIIFNGIVLYNDYDSEVLLETLNNGDEVYGEQYPPISVVPNRLWQFDNYIVTSMNVEIVEFHHCIVSMQGEYRNN